MVDKVLDNGLRSQNKSVAGAVSQSWTIGRCRVVVEGFLNVNKRIRAPELVDPQHLI